MGGEEGCAEGDREDVGDGFCEEYCEDLVGKKGGHDVDERDEEDDLSHAGDHDGGFCVAYGGERGLAGHLDGEEACDCHIDSKQRCGVGDQALYIREDAREGLWEEHDAEPKSEGIYGVDLDEQSKGLLYAVLVAGSKVVAYDWLCALSKSVERQEGELHDA